MDLKFKREYIMVVGENSEATDCMTGAVLQVSEIPF